ncbi:SNF2 family N-terminal domain-containing protein, partial [Zopfochytrium polystomum]
HPELATVWAELGSTPISKTDQISQPEDIRLKLLPFQLEGVSWLQNQELSQFNGGILADEMGMGKTIQLISLLVTRRDVKPNLILTPTVAILQWLAEIKERVAPDVLSVCVYHGQNRETSAEALASHDVVLSTYAIVEGGYRKQQYGFKRKGALVKEKSLIHSIKWGRVILDEAHSIKDRSCSTAKAVFSLDCRYKWSLTGTPLQNRVGELYSLIRFLNSDPFSYYFCKSCPCKSIKWSFSDHRHCDYCGHISHQHFCWWNMEILKPIQKYGGSGDGLIAFQKLGVLLDRIMLRRTKVERADDLGLPPRVVTVRKDLFNEAEEELYESLYSDSKRQFSTYVAANTVLNNYASIFSLLSRMRMTVNHPDLVLTKMNQKGTNSENLVCGICQEPAEDAVISKCKHLFCREDVREYMVSAPDDKSCTCPVCFRPLSIDLTQPEYVGKSGASDSARLSVVNYIDMSQWRSSTKIEALVEELTALQRDDATMKSIVFSQFVAFLDLIQWRLSRAGFTLVRLDGRMTPQARDNVIKSFTTDPAVTVFLVSLKAGGVALNLTEASRVFSKWWNPAAEDQAFDRIHRLGQTRPIKITRLIIENSIESRILQLQEKKKMLFQSTVGKDIDALAKLSAEDFQFLFTM